MTTAGARICFGISALSRAGGWLVSIGEAESVGRVCGCHGLSVRRRDWPCDRLRSGERPGPAAVEQLRDLFGLKCRLRVAAEISGPGGTARVDVKVYDEIDAVRRAIVAIEEEAARAAAEQLAAETGAAEEGAG